MSKYVSAKSLVAAVGFVGLALAAVPFIGHAAETTEASACMVMMDGGYDIGRDGAAACPVSAEHPGGILVRASFER